MVHNTIGNQSSIAKIAQWGIQVALQAGWHVTVVAQDVDKSLQADVEWLPLYVPPKAFLVQWLAARRTILAALGSRQFDVLHVHQAQVSSLADVLQCHFLTRVAYERHCLETRRGVKPALARLQQQGVLFAEDYYYKHWNPKTQMLFCSEMIGDEFGRLYGAPDKQQILVNPCPALSIPTNEMRHMARLSLIGTSFTGTVIGYLGGVDERKGYRQLIASLEGAEDIFLLMGGPNSQGFSAQNLMPRFKSLGMVSDLKMFFAACDILIVPSYFDPCPVVVFEAAACGIPVIATNGVGNLKELRKFVAGEQWETGTSLPALVRKMAQDLDAYDAGSRKMITELSSQKQGAQLLNVYDTILHEKRQNR